jgi:hypothetical protein
LHYEASASFTFAFRVDTLRGRIMAIRSLHDSPRLCVAGGLRTSQRHLPGHETRARGYQQRRALLTPEQLHRLRVAVSPPQHSRGVQRIPVSNCYIPHNAFVFYNAAKTPVVYLEVCFSCLGYTAQPRIPAAVPNYLPLAVIFEELKLPMGPCVTAKAFGKARLRELQTN